jgi:hypothetical protein
MRPVVLTILTALGFGCITPLTSVEPHSYRFTVLATIPGPAPGPEGDKFTPDASDFEPGQLNGRGELALVADLVDAGGSPIGEGVFLQSNGSPSRIIRPGQAAPGGGVFLGANGRVALNDPGDLAVTALLNPFSFPIGVNTGIYWKRPGGPLDAVVVPGATSAPTGGTFAGVTLAHQPSLNNLGEIVFGGIVSTANGIHLTYEPYLGLGVGIFGADGAGAILSLVSPGTPALAGELWTTRTSGQSTPVAISPSVVTWRVRSALRVMRRIRIHRRRSRSAAPAVYIFAVLTRERDCAGGPARSGGPRRWVFPIRQLGDH